MFPSLDSCDSVLDMKKLVTWLVRLSPDLAARIDAEWHRRGLRSRSETIRVLLGEALGEGEGR